MKEHMNVRWGAIQSVLFARCRKPIEIKTAIIKGVPRDRFTLFQPRSKHSIATMWALHDSVTGTTHFLHGEGWKGAQRAAECRIIPIIQPKRAKAIQAKEEAEGIERMIGMGFLPPKK